VNKTVVVPADKELPEFINFLFDGLEGQMYVVAKEPQNPESWDQVFFDYPTQVDRAVEAINKFSATHDIYIAPVLYKSQRAVKENFKVGQVFWCDFDGNTPESFDIPPSYNIHTSEGGHNHVYWKLDKPCTDSTVIEDYNRRLTFKYDADASGWDITQVLRPPFTISHKRGGTSVFTEAGDSNLCFNLEVFADLTPAPEKSVDYSLWEKLDLPSLESVIYSNALGPDFQRIFEMQREQVNDRSASLTSMAYACAESGLSDKEIYVVLSHLATRWEKFKHHTQASRARQLIGIIEHARIKFPDNNFGDIDQVFEYSPLGLLTTDIQVEWAIPGLLMKNGVMVMSGPGGVGKSQISMQFMAHLAMGIDFMNFKIEKPQKIGWFSLEMGDMEIKSFLQEMYPIWQKKYGDEAMERLNKNWQILAFGEALGLNTTVGQSIFIKWLEERQWEGVFIDSVGSAIVGNINSAENVQPFTNFNDKVRKRYGCFLWYIHHFRKPPPGTKSSGGAEDSYGDVYITNRATTLVTVTRKADSILRIKNPKNRHAKELPDFIIERIEGLFFNRLEDDIVSNVDKFVNQIKMDSKAPIQDSTPKPFA
jgi:hypothetical protein